MICLCVGWMAWCAPPGRAATLREVPAIEVNDAVGRGEPFQGRAFVPVESARLEGARSITKAVVLSLLVPGLGQQYLGESNSARTFYAAEGVIWTSFAVFQVQGHLREDGYQEYAQRFAGVTSSDHSDDYYKLLTRFDSFQQYENEIKAEGRLLLYPDVDAATLEDYFRDNRVSDYEPWVWQSVAVRRAYQERRSASRRAYRRALYSVAAALANRAASAFFAVRSARAMKREGGVQRTGFHIEFGAGRTSTSDGFQTGVSVVRSF